MVLRVEAVDICPLGHVLGYGSRGLESGILNGFLVLVFDVSVVAFFRAVDVFLGVSSGVVSAGRRCPRG